MKVPKETEEQFFEMFWAQFFLGEWIKRSIRSYPLLDGRKYIIEEYVNLSNFKKKTIITLLDGEGWKTTSIDSE